MNDGRAHADFPEGPRVGPPEAPGSASTLPPPPGAHPAAMAPTAMAPTTALPRLDPPPTAMQVRPDGPTGAANLPPIAATNGARRAPSRTSSRTPANSGRAQPVVHGAVAGLLGGLIAAFVAFVVLSSGLDDIVGDDAGDATLGVAFVKLVIPFVVGGMLIGATLLALTGWLTGSTSKALRDGVRGGLTGALGGVLGAVLGVLLAALVLLSSVVPVAGRHNEIQQFSRSDVEDALASTGWAIFVLWLLLGWLLGTAIGIARGAKRVAVGSVAGLISGILAGLVARVLVADSIVSAMVDDLPANLRSLDRFSDIDRYIAWDDVRTALALMLFVGFVIVGPLIGSVSGVFETVRKNGWILISAGPLSGKQFILHQDRTLVGSNHRCDIVLGRDRDIAPTHAEFVRTLNGMTVTARDGAAVIVNGRQVATATLRNGDTIRIGQSQLDYEERA